MAFNPAQWAKDHEKADDMRFGAIFRVLTIAGTCLIGTLAWSLKTQYDAIAANEQRAQAELTAISNLQRHVDVAVGPAVLSNSR